MPKETRRVQAKTKSPLIIALIIIILVLVGVILYFTLSKSNSPPSDSNTDNKIPDGAIACPPQRGEFCAEIYEPVCGWFDSKKIQCIKYPCAQTFSNSCFACGNKDVLYYTEGECHA